MAADQGKMTPITCIGRDNIQRTFYYQMVPGRSEGPGYSLHIFSTDAPTGHFFEAGFVEWDDSELQVVAMDHHLVPTFIARGIPEAVIIEASVLSSRIVVSSTNGASKRVAGEFQTPEAEKVWLRLVQGGHAEKRQDGRFALIRR